jgi:hypothetical protein
MTRTEWEAKKFVSGQVIEVLLHSIPSVAHALVDEFVSVTLRSGKVETDQSGECYVQINPRSGIGSVILLANIHVARADNRTSRED